MPFVRIDDALMAHLREHGRFGDTHNDIVRRLLGMPPAERVSARAGASGSGALMPLIAAGTLAVGDTVTWYRRNLGEVHTATVDDAGRLVTADGAVHITPGTCASSIAGYPCKGWPNWRTAAGASLQQLRDRAAEAIAADRPTSGAAAG
ncbi:restriction system modified-DNA reader domain-containing protein [Phytohabitans aurantiacus]|uniref:RAMA domain-containing protein n=1 Tax=Phytohabitans aurantiacus TaxID=3016789 RepID=A0ABQ5RBC1_9ACTN|nr:hypothetical protein [Phytohabitans aurantiacus]GLI03700.1 hypothetical protein Pa4123_89790 [Phytohabitans aurantiacus]